MKKLIAILLAVAMIAAMATAVSAAENTMVLKTTVPAATYTLSIPAALEIPFGTEQIDFPRPEVIESAGFEGRDLRFYISDVGAIGDDNYRMPMEILTYLNEPYGPEVAEYKNGQSLYYVYTYGDGVLDDVDCYSPDEDDEMIWIGNFILRFEKEDWYKLSPGEHTGYIEFTSEVVPNYWEP